MTLMVGVGEPGNNTLRPVTSDGVNTGRNVQPDETYLPLYNQTTLSGPSNVFDDACIYDRGFEDGFRITMRTVGNWTFAYYVQIYSPDVGGNYTYRYGEACIFKPMSGTRYSPC